MLTTSYPVPTNKASGIFVSRLVQSLQDQVSVTVITPAPQHYHQIKELDSNIKLFSYAPKNMQMLAQAPGGIPEALKRHKWSVFLLPSFLVSMAIKCLIFAQKVDVIHANWTISGCIGGLVGKILNKPVITTVRGEDMTRAKSSILDRILLKSCLLLCQKIVSVSRRFKYDLEEQFPNQAHKIELIENGVDEVFIQSGLRRSPASDPDSAQLITVGSLIKRKGMDCLIEALAKINKPNIRLTVVGDGPEKSYLQTLCTKHRLNQKVVFLGKVNPVDIANLFEKHDIFLLASYSEGRPNVILEAMAAALPIIASDIPGTNELIQNQQTGLSFPSGDIDCLVRQIDLLLNNTTLQNKLGKAAQQYVQSNQLLWPQAAQKYIQMYYDIKNQQNNS